MAALSTAGPAGKMANLHIRARTLAAVREFFARRDYLEVETPNRLPAPMPEAHIDAEPSGAWHLHTSPEICMKRLLAAGFPRIFQICKCYRQKERGSRHLPEFTLLEWYAAGRDYRYLMDECEDLVRHAAACVHGPDRPLFHRGEPIDLSPPWPRMTVADAFNRFAGISMRKALTDNLFDEIIAFEIEPALPRRRPLFLYDYPAALTPLARPKPEDPSIAERFELYLGGLEISNAFSELTDPAEQRRRLEAENRLRRAAGKKSHPLPEKFLHALEGMPAAAGNALGLDRLVMILADAERIDQVVAFTPEDL